MVQMQLMSECQDAQLLFVFQVGMVHIPHCSFYLALVSLKLTHAQIPQKDVCSQHVPSVDAIDLHLANEFFITHNINIRNQSITVVKSANTTYAFLSRLIHEKTLSLGEQHHKVLITYLTYTQQVHPQTFYIQNVCNVRQSRQRDDSLPLIFDLLPSQKVALPPFLDSKTLKRDWSPVMCLEQPL